MGNGGSQPGTAVINPGQEAPQPPVAEINCGSALQGHDSNERVTVSGKTHTSSSPSAEIKGDNASFISYGRSHRWSANDFTYSVNVPVPGEYDVTLVFAETYPGAFTVGSRVFNVAVSGVKTYEFNNVDVFKQVGANAVYKIELQNVPADITIEIALNKGSAENPFISGIVVGAVENPKETAGRPEIPAPDVLVSEAQYNDCIKKIEDYVALKKSNAPSKVSRVADFMFHAPGTPVRGLIVTFHGFSGWHYDHRILNRYLYDQGYDIFNTMLAGHMYTGEHWPSTKLSKDYGGDTIKKDIAQDPELLSLVTRANGNPGLIPELLTRLTAANPDFERVMSAQAYMSSLDSDEDPNFSKFFDSDHRRYLTEGTEQLRLVDSHPGPVHVTGLSVGGAAALAVAAANPERISRCCTMAPLLELFEEYPGTKRSQVNYIGPLGIAPDFAWNPEIPFPVSSFTGAGRLGGALTSSEKYKDVFRTKQVQMFMVLTEDEDAADIPTNKNFFADCGGRPAGHHFFNYPLSYRVPHPLLDPSGLSRGRRNSYYKTLYQNCFTFFAVGYVDSPQMLRKPIDTSLPDPPHADHGGHGPFGIYGRAAQTSKQTASN